MADNCSGYILKAGAVSAAMLLLYTATSFAQIPGSTASQVQPGYMVAPGVSGCPSTGPACWLPTNPANPLPVAVTPSPSAGTLFTSSTTLTSSIVAKAAAGALYSFDVAADTTLSTASWWVMVYNATAAPADGAVTPAKCYMLTAGTNTFTGAFPNAPTFSTGIVVGVSTAGCFTKSASTHAFISVDYE